MLAVALSCKPTERPDRMPPPPTRPYNQGRGRENAHVARSTLDGYHRSVTEICPSRYSIPKASAAIGANASRLPWCPVAHTSKDYEAWIMADPFRGGFQVLIAGPQGFQRAAAFALDEDPATIKERVRETMEAD
jgi:hypothetical protein